MEIRAGELRGTRIETIYFGGGTPSLISADELHILFDAIQGQFKLSADAEITLEANPDDLSPDKISELAESPVNRLSIGVQSYFDDDLKRMNRAHSASESIRSVEQALKHFQNITIDLIYGIPEMDTEKWEANLNRATSSGVPHISAYALTVEPRTALHHFIKTGKYPPLDEQQAYQHYKMLVFHTHTQGLVHYEISNFGKPGYFSKHNTAYWSGKTYLGLGPSAHSFDGSNRRWNVSNNSQYIKALNSGKLPLTVEQLSDNDRFNEYIMTGLRTIWGVDLDKVLADFGPDYSAHLKNTSARFIDQGLLGFDESRLLATEEGKFLVDGLASDLFVI